MVTIQDSEMMAENDIEIEVTGEVPTFDGGTLEGIEGSYTEESGEIEVEPVDHIPAEDDYDGTEPGYNESGEIEVEAVDNIPLESEETGTELEVEPVEDLTGDSGEVFYDFDSSEAPTDYESVTGTELAPDYSGFTDDIDSMEYLLEDFDLLMVVYDQETDNHFLFGYSLEEEQVEEEFGGLFSQEYFEAGSMFENSAASAATTSTESSVSSRTDYDTGTEYEESAEEWVDIEVEGVENSAETYDSVGENADLPALPYGETGLPAVPQQGDPAYEATEGKADLPAVPQPGDPAYDAVEDQ